MPRVGPLSEHAPTPVKVVLNWGRRYSLWVFNFGLACCAIEFIAASMARHDFIRLGVIPFAPGPRQADLMVVSGTVTDKMAPAIRRLYDEMPEPKYVISFGACSNSGGPYWDSYSVLKGVDSIIPVDVYVPGCPPRPEALLQGIVTLQAKIAGETLSGQTLSRRYAGGRLASAGAVTRPLVDERTAAIPGRGDALGPRAQPTPRADPAPTPAAKEPAPTQPTPVVAELAPTQPTPVVAEPELAPTQQLPVVAPPTETQQLPVVAPPAAQPRPQAQPRPHTLADDLFALGEDDE